MICCPIIICNTVGEHFFLMNKTDHLHNNITLSNLNIHILSLMGEKAMDLGMAEKKN